MSEAINVEKGGFNPALPAVGNPAPGDGELQRSSPTDKNLI